MPSKSMTPSARRRIGIAAALALLSGGMLFAGQAAAGSFKVNPVQIHLPAGRNAASLNITNSDAAPVSIRVTAFAWAQVDGIGVYTPTSDVIASPPIFTIPAGKTQLIRVGLRHRSSSAYRVQFEEIPREQAADGQIKVLLRLNLPLYLMPKGGGKADLRWSAWRGRSGELVIEGRNRGTVYAQVVELSTGQGTSRNILSAQMGVVLPGSARRWKIAKQPGLPAGTRLALNIRNATSETQTQILVEQR